MNIDYDIIIDDLETILCNDPEVNSNSYEDGAGRGFYMTTVWFSQEDKAKAKEYLVKAFNGGERKIEDKKPRKNAFSRCPYCHAMLHYSEKFCHNCGEKNIRYEGEEK